MPLFPLYISTGLSESFTVSLKSYALPSPMNPGVIILILYNTPPNCHIGSNIICQVYGHKVRVCWQPHLSCQQIRKMVRCLLREDILPGFSILDITLAVMKVEITAIVLHKNRFCKRKFYILWNTLQSSESPTFSLPPKLF